MIEPDQPPTPTDVGQEPDFLAVLRSDTDAAEIAAATFAFDITRADHVEPVRLASGAALEPVAGDDTGGTYFLCAAGPERAVLYADSEGTAGLIGDNLAEALEVLIGLPAWRDVVHQRPGIPPQALRTALDEAEDELREYLPDLDEERATLLATLGLHPRPQSELLARLRDATDRTEPDYLLLNAVEGCAYRPLVNTGAPLLRDTILETADADLARLRGSADAWALVAHSPVAHNAGPDAPATGEGRRAAVLRSAQYDRRESDAPLLHHLLEQELALHDERRTTVAAAELALAAVLLAEHERPGDLPLLRCALQALRAPADAGPVPGPEDVLRWARETDATRFGAGRLRDSDTVWAGIARRLGRTETARVALLHLLDEHDFGRYLEAHDPGLARTEALRTLDADALTTLRDEFLCLGDSWQAARAQRSLDHDAALTAG